jgi:ferric-dicitrate binding protein FerR (iron transport regulator)
MSTSMHTPLPSAVEEEAALWFAKRRRGVMSLEECASFDSWRRVPLNAAAFAEQERIWDALEIAQSRLGPNSTPRHVRARVGRPALLAVMCAASIAIGVISYTGNHGFWTNLDWVER